MQLSASALRPNSKALTLARGTGLACLYFCVGMLGLLLAFGFGRAQIVWSSAGIAFAGLALFGLRFWPAIAIADMFLSVAAGYGPVEAVGITASKVLEAVIGVYLYRQYAPEPGSFRTIRDVLVLIGTAATGCMAGAAIGTGSMMLLNTDTLAPMGQVWANWWFGDLLSDLILAPFILKIAAAPWRSWDVRRTIEAVLLLSLFILTALFVFGRRVVGDNLLIPYTFPLLPLLIWAALRFEQLGAAIVSLLISTLALFTATRSTAPLSQPEFNRALLTVHSYMFVVTITSYCLGAAVTARRIAQEHAASLSEELRALARKLEVAREEERVHLAREIHDQLGQQLTGLGLALAALKRKLPDQDPVVLKKSEEMDEILHETIETVQRLALELRPGVINELSLPEAMQWLAEKSSQDINIPITFRSDVTGLPLDPDCKLAVFRIFQEAFANLARHSGATAATLQITARNGRSLITLQDDGIGIDDAARASARSLGIVGMRERAHACGAELRIDRSPALGTSERPGTMVEVELGSI